MSEKIRLTYPSTHSESDISSLVAHYRDEFPDRYRTWLSIEKRGDKLGEDDLAEVQRHAIEFLINNTKCDSRIAAASAWFDMRLQIIRNALSH